MERKEGYIREVSILRLTNWATKIRKGLLCYNGDQGRKKRMVARFKAILLVEESMLLFGGWNQLHYKWFMLVRLTLHCRWRTSYLTRGWPLDSTKRFTEEQYVVKCVVDAVDFGRRATRYRLDGDAGIPQVVEKKWAGDFEFKIRKSLIAYERVLPVVAFQGIWGYQPRIPDNIVGISLETERCHHIN